jgi:hypothetical protein
MTLGSDHVQFVRNLAKADITTSTSKAMILHLTGYSLSDQHILSPIKPKIQLLILSDLQGFTQIVLKFKPCKTCVLNFRTICVNLRKI